MSDHFSSGFKKYMRNDFYKSDTYKIVQAMKATGNQPGIVAQWKAAVERWAQSASGPEVEAVRAWLPLWRVRPFYSATELAPLWPALSLALGLTAHPSNVLKSASRLANELKFAGLPYIAIDDEIFFIVEQIHRWSKQPPTPEELKEFFHA